MYKKQGMDPKEAGQRVGELWRKFVHYYNKVVKENKQELVDCKERDHYKKK